MSNKRDIHIVPKQGQWATVKEGSQRASGVYELNGGGIAGRGQRRERERDCGAGSRRQMKTLDRLFGKPEEINGANRCPTYLYRWTIFKWGKRGIYLHHFVADDWSLDLHDHPQRFLSIGLRGSYIEYTPDCDIVGLGEKFEIFKAPWIRSFPANHIHRLVMVRSGGANGTTEKIHDCWTLVFVGDATRQWGFWHEGRFIGWREYVKSDTADKMKACD